MSNITHEFESRLTRPTQLKLPEFERNGRLFHLILPHQLSKPMLRRLKELADKIRDLHRSKKGADELRGLLSHKRLILYFTQPSTRTRGSFRAAGEHLGMRVEPVDDPKVSSEMKGESEYDSIRMHCGNADAIVMRTQTPNFTECSAYMMNDQISSGRKGVPIINGGSGADQHPTQALLDVYTLLNAFSFESTKDSSQWTYFDSLQSKFPKLRKGIDGKCFVFCGDIGRGRTIRSLAYLLSHYDDVKMAFVAPDHKKLRLSRDLKTFLINQNVEISEHLKLSEVISDADALYMTRVQAEHNKKSDLKALSSKALKGIKLTQELAESMKDYAVILHPLPRNDEIPPEIDTNSRARYLEQAENGQWIRAALLAHIFDVENQVDSLYADFSQDFHSYNEEVL